jgi:diacylglycerol kinase (ATP)
VKVALVCNPASGSGDAGEIAELLRERGTAVEELPVERAAEAAGAGADRIVAAGGDGTLGVAAEVAARCGLPLAVVAAGTANDFAARMGLPAEHAEAAELATGGRRTRPVDLGRVGPRPFLNVASLGLAPAAAEAAEELKKLLGRLAYSLGAARAAVSEEPLDCRVRCDEHVLLDGAAWQVTVGCSGAFGAGARIDADADDGLLDVVALEAGPRGRLAKHAVGLRAGSVEGQRGAHSRRCLQVAIDAPGCESLNVDGELVDAAPLRDPDGELRMTAERHAFELVIG